MNKEVLALEFLGDIIKTSPFAGKVFLAGGAVRDEVMGKDIKDIDIVVADKEGGIVFANWLTKQLGAYREGANPVVFPRFGTAKFNLRGVKYKGVDLSTVDIESVMTRGEQYFPGSRKPTVVYADLKTDVERRDFTVNTLLKDLTTGKILDLTGKGMDDIKRGIIRTPIDPDITFKDDPLRMLRAIRFATKYNWKFPRSLVDALIKNSIQLKNISSERTQDEFNKMIMTDSPDVALKLLEKTGLLKQFMPELSDTVGVGQNQFHKDDVFNHICEVVKKTPPNLTARLSAILHDIGKPLKKTEDDTGIHFYRHEEVGAKLSTEILKRLKYPNDITSSVSKIVENHMRLKASGPKSEKLTDKALRRFVVDMGEDIVAAMGVMSADNLSHEEGSVMPDQIPSIIERMKTVFSNVQTPKAQLPINGHDIMNTFGVTPGPYMKTLLGAVEDAWYENPDLSKEDALRIVKSFLEEPTAQTNMNDLLQQTIINPETDNRILVKTALQYDETHPARRAAEDFIKRNR